MGTALPRSNEKFERLYLGGSVSWTAGILDTIPRLKVGDGSPALTNQLPGH